MIVIKVRLTVESCELVIVYIIYEEETYRERRGEERERETNWKTYINIIFVLFSVFFALSFSIERLNDFFFSINYFGKSKR